MADIVIKGVFIRFYTLPFAAFCYNNYITIIKKVNTFDVFYSNFVYFFTTPAIIKFKEFKRRYKCGNYLIHIPKT